jgi:hypothetical protein
MREELHEALTNDPLLQIAIDEFNLAAENHDLFNCLYSQANRHNIPPINQNYEYIRIPRGQLRHLPSNFKMTEIGQDIIENLHNDLHIPQLF